MDEDYRVPPRSDEEIEAFVAGWRKVLVGTAPRFDIIATIEMAGREFQTTHGLQLLDRSDAEMDRLEAYAQWVKGSPRIFAKRSIVDLASKNDPRGISTLTHELMHVILEHRRNDDEGAILPRLVTTNRRPKYIALYESAEHQARVATAEFLMPRAEVRKLTSVDQIIERFGTSNEASTIRYDEVILQKRHRDTPESVKSYLSTRKSLAPAAPVQRAPYVPVRSQTNIDKVWEAASLAPNADPAEYRLSQSGFLVKRSDYLKTSRCGWFVHNNQIYAHQDTAAATQAESELCIDCGNFTLRRNGLALKCDACGERSQL